MSNGFNTNWNTVGNYSNLGSKPIGSDIFSGGTGGWVDAPKNYTTFGDYSSKFGSSSPAFSTNKQQPLGDIFSTKNADVLSDVFGGLLDKSKSGSGDGGDGGDGDNKYQKLMEDQNKRLDALEKAKQYQMQRTHQVTPELSIHYPPDPSGSGGQPMVIPGQAAGPSTVQKLGGVATGLASAGVLGPWGAAIGLGAQLFG